MAEGVRGDPGAVERDGLATAVGRAGVDGGDGVDPGPDPDAELVGVDVAGAVGVLVGPGQQPQALALCPGEALGHPALLGPDGVDQGGVGQWQAPGHPPGLVVVVDEDRLPRLVDVQAVEVQAGNLAQSPAGALQQPVGHHRHLAGLVAQHPHRAETRPAGGPLAAAQQVQVGVELGDDMGGDGPALLFLDNAPVGVAPAEREGRAQPGEEAHLGCLANDQPASLGNGEGRVRRQRLAGDG
ncbi:MAG: hypothetical protein ACR2MO_09985 [Acidimicrobiales bacterium]